MNSKNQASSTSSVRNRDHAARSDHRRGDSHTSTHGAFGTLAFGIGTSEVEHVLATQCLSRQNRKRFTFGSRKTPKGVTAKDIILSIIGKNRIGGGTGHVAEYGGQAIRELSMEGRMTSAT